LRERKKKKEQLRTVLYNLNNRAYAEQNGTGENTLVNGQL